jgi:hypothetical protein
MAATASLVVGCFSAATIELRAARTMIEAKSVSINLFMGCDPFSRFVTKGGKLQMG